MHKILIACPVYGGMDYCFRDFINHLKAIEYFKFDIVIFDNSKSKKFFRKIRKIKGIEVFYDDTTEEKNKFRLISSRNKILDYAKENNYDSLLMMDCDVMVPSNILGVLMSHNKDVVSGLYFNIFNVSGENKLLPVCYQTLEEEDYLEMKRKNMVPSFVNSREDIRRNITRKEIENGFLEVLYPSAGCMLLSKKAFSSGARYGLFEGKNNLPTTDDIYFFKELRKKGFKLYCDPNMVCQHDVLKKYEKGKTHGFAN